MLHPCGYDTNRAGDGASPRAMCSGPDAAPPVAATDAIAVAVVALVGVAAQVEQGVAELRTSAVGVAVPVTKADGVGEAAAPAVELVVPAGLEADDDAVQVTGTEMAARTVDEPEATSVKLFG
jgi:hypothetical protein